MFLSFSLVYLLPILNAIYFINQQSLTILSKRRTKCMVTPTLPHESFKITFTRDMKIKGNFHVSYVSESMISSYDTVSLYTIFVKYMVSLFTGFSYISGVIRVIHVCKCY